MIKFRLFEDLRRPSENLLLTSMSGVFLDFGIEVIELWRVDNIGFE